MKLLAQQLALITAVTGFGLSGCSTLKAIVGMGPVRPKVTLASVDLVGMSPTDINLAVRLNINNPNDFNLTLKELTYELDGEGVVFAKGQKRDLTSVPAEGKALVSLPITVSIGKAVALIERLITKGEPLAIEVRAQCQFSTPAGYMLVNLKETHSIYGNPK